MVGIELKNGGVVKIRLENGVDIPFDRPVPLSEVQEIIPALEKLERLAAPNRISNFLRNTTDGGKAYLRVLLQGRGWMWNSEVREALGRSGFTVKGGTITSQVIAGIRRGLCAAAKRSGLQRVDEQKWSDEHHENRYRIKPEFRNELRAQLQEGN